MAARNFFQLPFERLVSIAAACGVVVSARKGHGRGGTWTSLCQYFSMRVRSKFVLRVKGSALTRLCWRAAIGAALSMRKAVRGVLEGVLGLGTAYCGCPMRLRRTCTVLNAVAGRAFYQPGHPRRLAALRPPDSKEDTWYQHALDFSRRPLPV